MKKILEQLYNGEIAPIDQHKPLLDEYRNNFYKKTEAFENKLDEYDEQLKGELQILMDEYCTLFPVEMAQEYANGFKLGAKVVFEIFSEGARK